jgi:hypothetical protein
MISTEFLKKTYIPSIKAEYQKIQSYEESRVKEGKNPWPGSYFEDLSTYDVMTRFAEGVSAADLVRKWSENCAKPRILVPFSGCYEFDSNLPVELAVGITAKNWDLKGKELLPAERFPEYRKVVEGNIYLKSVWNKSRALAQGRGFDIIFCRPLEPFANKSSEYTPLSPAEALDKNYLAYLYRYVFLIKEIYKSLSDPGVAYGQMPWLPFDSFSLGLFEAKFNSFFARNSIDFKCTYIPERPINYFRMVKHMDSPVDLDQLDFGELLSGHLNILGCRECIMKEHYCRLFGVTSSKQLHSIARSAETGAQYSNKSVRLSTDSHQSLDNRTRTVVSTGWSHSKPITAICQNAKNPEIVYAEYGSDI